MRLAAVMMAHLRSGNVCTAPVGLCPVVSAAATQRGGGQSDRVVGLLDDQCARRWSAPNSSPWPAGPGASARLLHRSRVRTLGQHIPATSGDARIVGLVVHSGRLITTPDDVITVGGAR